MRCLLGVAVFLDGRSSRAWLEACGRTAMHGGDGGSSGGGGGG